MQKAEETTGGNQTLAPAVPKHRIKIASSANSATLLHTMSLGDPLCKGFEDYLNMILKSSADFHFLRKVVDFKQTIFVGGEVCFGFCFYQQATVV